MSDIPQLFDEEYYTEEYFKTPAGKKFLRPNGKLEGWSYANPTGESPWFKNVNEAWKQIFDPIHMLDVGCGRGTTVAYARDLGIHAYGFDFSAWAVGDEGRYARCKKEWLKQHDATKPWPYPKDRFDFLVALDFWEHIYVDDLEFTIKEMFRVSSKWIFLQIATVGGGCGLLRPPEKGYILEKNKPVPIELEGNAVAGHVTVQPETFWLDRLDHDDWVLRRDLVPLFVSHMGDYMNKNWLLNTMIVLEKM